MIVAPVCVKLRRWGWLWIYGVMVTVFHRLGVGTWAGRRGKGLEDGLWCFAVPLPFVHPGLPHPDPLPLSRRGDSFQLRVLLVLKRVG